MLKVTTAIHVAIGIMLELSIMVPNLARAALPPKPVVHTAPITVAPKSAVHATPILPVARDSSEGNLTVCGSEQNIQGTDVTDYANGTDWDSVHQGGTGFVFIKATEGNDFTNSLFASDWKASGKSGLKRGAYHFFRPQDEGLTQAKFFLDTIGKLSADDLAPVLDWETTDDVDNALQISRALDWLKTVEAATGRVPIIYVSPGFFNQLGNPKEFVRYPLFIADWDTSCPSVPPPWSKWTFWQNTKSGSIPGLVNDADIDVFGGTAKDLRGLTRASPLR